MCPSAISSSGVIPRHRCRPGAYRFEGAALPIGKLLRPCRSYRWTAKLRQRRRARIRRKDQDRQWYRDHDMALIEPSIAIAIGAAPWTGRSNQLGYKLESTPSSSQIGIKPGQL